MLSRFFLLSCSLFFPQQKDNFLLQERRVLLKSNHHVPVDFFSLKYPTEDFTCKRQTEVSLTLFEVLSSLQCILGDENLVLSTIKKAGESQLCLKQPSNPE